MGTSALIWGAKILRKKKKYRFAGIPLIRRKTRCGKLQENVQKANKTYFFTRLKQHKDKVGVP